jgi:hypothetical protein
MLEMPTIRPMKSKPFEAIAECYFAALGGGNDLATVPWSEDVRLHTPLHKPGPIEGRAAVEAFFRPMVGCLGSIRLIDLYVNQTQDIFLAEAQIGPLHVVDKFVIRSGKIIIQENIFDPRPVLQPDTPGGISPAERELTIEMLAASRDSLRSAVKTISPAQWQQTPATEAWSPAECLEHLVLTEEALLGMIRSVILSSPANPAQAIEQRGKDAPIIRIMASREKKRKTADFLQPRGNWSHSASLLDAFLARRADTLDFVRSTRDPLRHHFAPLDDLGLLDGYQWLLLMAAHTNRHVEQIKEAAR